MKAWIAAHYPGTKLSISEYNWGSDDGISGALAQAEALAIFGREGVDLATRWVAPADGLAHRGRVPPLPQLRRRGRAGRGRLRARDERERRRRRRVRAARRSGWKHALPPPLQQGHRRRGRSRRPWRAGSPGTASLFRFSGSSRLAAAGARRLRAGRSRWRSRPARRRSRSWRLRRDAPPPAATSFHAAAPCRLLDTRGAAGPRSRRTRAADVVLTGACGIPATAKALSANVTVTVADVRGQPRRVPGRSRAGARHEHTELRRGSDAGEQRDSPPRLATARAASRSCADALRHRPPRRGRERLVGVSLRSGHGESRQAVPSDRAQRFPLTFRRNLRLRPVRADPRAARDRGHDRRPPAERAGPAARRPAGDDGEAARRPDAASRSRPSRS